MPDYKLVIEYSNDKPIHRYTHVKLQSGDCHRDMLRLLKKYLVEFAKLGAIIPIKPNISQGTPKCKRTQAQ